MSKETRVLMEAADKFLKEWRTPGSKGKMYRDEDDPTKAAIEAEKRDTESKEAGYALGDDEVRLSVTNIDGAKINAAKTAILKKNDISGITNFLKENERFINNLNFINIDTKDKEIKKEFNKFLTADKISKIVEGIVEESTVTGKDTVNKPEGTGEPKQEKVPKETAKVEDKESDPKDVGTKDTGKDPKTAVLNKPKETGMPGMQKPKVESFDQTYNSFLKKYNVKLDEASQYNTWKVSISYNDPSSKGVATFLWKGKAPDKYSAEKYAKSDLSKKEDKVKNIKITRVQELK